LQVHHLILGLAGVAGGTLLVIFLFTLIAPVVHFAFGSGPAIRLVQAKQFLTERQILGRESNGQLWIAPAAVGGLVIALVED